MTTGRRLMLAAAALAGASTVNVTTGPSLATPRHHQMMRSAPPNGPARRPLGFYPNDIDGGVRGNLPFNNQIRKMVDPLNANGAGR